LAEGDRGEEGDQVKVRILAVLLVGSLIVTGSLETFWSVAPMAVISGILLFLFETAVREDEAAKHG
jgi:hypothetical protein